MDPALAADISFLPQRHRQVLQDVVQALVEGLGDRLRQVILFGSAARGEVDEESDLDLLIVAEEGNERLGWEVVQLTEEPLLAWDCRPWIDFISWPEEHFQQHQRIGTRFVRAVQMEGAVLWPRA